MGWIIGIGYLIGAAYTYALTFGYLQSMYKPGEMKSGDQQEDFVSSIIVGAIWPFGILATIKTAEDEGVKLRWVSGLRFW